MTLILEEVDVAYGATQVLWGVSLTLGAGEVGVVMGPNGSGKSTILKAITGLSPPRAGRIAFEGRDLRALEAHDMPGAGIGLVLERRRLFPDMTVLENVRIGAFHRAAQERADETFAWVRGLFPIIDERASDRAGMLSGGQQQMIAIARGLMASPRLLLMDEPFLGLAPAMVTRIAELVREINGRGIGVLFNEQNVGLSLDLADRAYLLEGGRLILGGTSAEVGASGLIQEVYLGQRAEGTA